MLYPDVVKVFTLPLEPDGYGGQSRGAPEVLVPTLRARLSVMSTVDVHTELGITHTGPGRFWRMISEVVPGLIWPSAAPLYVCLESPGSVPLIRADKAYEVLRHRNQRRGSGKGHHTSWTLQYSDLMDTTVFNSTPEDATNVGLQNRWRTSFVWEGSATIRLPGLVAIGDYVVLYTEHGGDRSLDQVSGTDFSILADGRSLNVTNILDIFEEDCTVSVVNYGRRAGVVWVENYLVTDTDDVKALAHTVKDNSLLELTVETLTSRSLTYLSGRDFTVAAPNTVNVDGLDISVGNTLHIVNYGEVPEV